MSVGNELRPAQRSLADTQQGRDMEGFELRIDRDSILVAQPALKADRLAIDQDQLDLGMRHAKRFDHVLGGRGLGAPSRPAGRWWRRAC